MADNYTRQQRAENALSDLNMGAAIQVLCESSLFRTYKGRTLEEKIIKLCREHGQRQLRDYDKNGGGQ